MTVHAIWLSRCREAACQTGCSTLSDIENSWPCVTGASPEVATPSVGGENLVIRSVSTPFACAFEPDLWPCGSYGIHGSVAVPNLPIAGPLLLQPMDPALPPLDVLP
ncbi:MAG: hypothetical protein ACYDDF_15415 [Thermoplasmatota archaeon]